MDSGELTKGIMLPDCFKDEIKAVLPYPDSSMDEKSVNEQQDNDNSPGCSPGNQEEVTQQQNQVDGDASDRNFSEDFLYEYINNEGYVGLKDITGKVVIEATLLDINYQGDYIVAQKSGTSLVKTEILMDRSGKKLLTDIEEKYGRIHSLEIRGNLARIFCDNSNFYAIVKLPEGYV